MKKSGFIIPAFFVLSNKPKSEQEFLKEVESRIPKVEYFAVRSSATCEDSNEKSFAGHFYSALGVKKENLINEINKVIESYKGAGGSIIIQEFIPSDKGGVIFSDAGDGRIIINSNFGLCDSVVKGYKCDEYIFNNNGDFIAKDIPSKKDALIFDNGLIKHKVYQGESLAEIEINKLLSAARKIELLFNKPQDIEWCFCNGILYILQSRPITKNIFSNEVSYFDSANIAESYSGIVLPLTCSFASHIYERVYKDLLIGSGVAKKKIVKYNEIFENMLGVFYGRMYYNMNNWYKMTAFLPGYKRNKENLEQMITSNVSEDIKHNISPSIWLKIKYPFLFLFKIFFFPLVIFQFKKRVRHQIQRARMAEIDKFSLKECQEFYNEIESRLLNNWYRTVENDFMVMTYLGWLRKIYPEETIKKIIQFNSQSTGQIKALQDIAVGLKNDFNLWQSIKIKNEQLFKKSLLDNKQLEQKINQYFLKYGGRFANELKLESDDIETDFKKFSAIIELYAKAEIIRPQKFKDDQDDSLYKKIFGRLILKKFKKYSVQREELRLLRSNVFAIIRKLFNRVGDIYYQNDRLEDKKDIFYLKIEEIFNDRSENLISIVKSMKEEYKPYQEVNLPSHFFIKPGEMPKFVNLNNSSGKVLKAKPCTPGRIKGKVKIFKNFIVPESIDFDIVVASRTDPGWTVLIGVAKGLIIEHGGILSHAAIVSRELGIPTVIGASNATQILKDNQIVELDGSNGLINIIS
ncbi:MAG: PEP/pyruvate-binding domain-containing protein [bacterium]|nr:PEP/pyruvate-binding domain-containing protein [bacterium]